MAILKMISTCHPTKAGNNATLKKCINYALNPKKHKMVYLPELLIAVLILR